MPITVAGAGDVSNGVDDATAAEAWLTAERIARATGAELPSPRHRPRNGEAVQLHGGPDTSSG